MTEAEQVALELSAREFVKAFVGLMVCEEPELDRLFRLDIKNRRWLLEAPKLK